jgi:hypothetical protein
VSKQPAGGAKANLKSTVFMIQNGNKRESKQSVWGDISSTRGFFAENST